MSMIKERQNCNTFSVISSIHSTFINQQLKLTVFICRFMRKHMQAHTFEAKTMKACMPICMTFNI